MYPAVVQSLEEFMQFNYDFCPLQFENDPSPGDMMDYYGRFTVEFGDNKLVCLGGQSRRQVGVIFLNLFAKPDTGMAKLQELAREFRQLFEGMIVTPAIEGTAPSVVIRDPQYKSDPNARDGWVTATVSFDFYFDTEC